MNFLDKLKVTKDKLLEQSEQLFEEQFQNMLDFFETVDEKTQQERFSICKSCEFFRSSISQCKKCGCYMPAKTWLAEQVCPEGKWEKISVKDLSQQ